MVDTRKRNKIRECIVNNEVLCLHEEARERVRMKKLYTNSRSWCGGAQREETPRVVQDRRGKGNRKEDK